MAYTVLFNGRKGTGKQKNNLMIHNLRYYIKSWVNIKINNNIICSKGMDALAYQVKLILNLIIYVLSTFFRVI